MKKALSLLFFLLNSQLLFAQNEIGPEGHKLLWIFLVLLMLLVVFIVLFKPFKKASHQQKKPLFTKQKLAVNLEKDTLYYPDNIVLTVKNTGNVDVDVDKPLLVFDNFWLRRKFKLKGTGNHAFYPLFLEKGKSHTLNIDLTRFYSHDKSLKKFPKASVYLQDVKGKKLGKKSTYLRKTLFRF